MTALATIADRRKSIRFPINLETQIKAPGLTATGKTINVSSGGALVQTTEQLSVGDSVEAHVQWPVSLDSCGLKLVMNGRVMWVGEGLIAIRRETYEFRTCGKR